jgi:hypothetical protein
LLGLRHFTAERLCEHLVPETDSHERFACVVELPDVILQFHDPVALFIGRVARARTDVGVARVGRRGKIAVHDVEPGVARAGHVRSEELLEHVAVTARDMAEALGDVVAA